MGYVIMLVLLAGFGWYWNKGFAPLHVDRPAVEKMPRAMVNFFLGAVLLMVILQAFGIGRGAGFPIPE
jgi:hypothetical protein